MTNGEIVRSYNQNPVSAQINTLAELNGVSKDEIKKVLTDAGCDIKVRKTTTKKTATKKITAKKADTISKTTKKQQDMESAVLLIKNLVSQEITNNEKIIDHNLNLIDALKNEYELKVSSITQQNAALQEENKKYKVFLGDK